MTLEPALVAALLTACPRVFPLVAPYGTAMPYITWQRIGGRALRYLDQSAPDKRNATVQISVWAQTSQQATALIQACEAALTASPNLQAAPQGEPMDSYSESDDARGVQQDFSVWGLR